MNVYFDKTNEKTYKQTFKTFLLTLAPAAAAADELCENFEIITERSWQQWNFSFPFSRFNRMQKYTKFMNNNLGAFYDDNKI